MFDSPERAQSRSASLLALFAAGSLVLVSGAHAASDRVPALELETGAFAHPAHVLHDVAPDGTFWAAGPLYKASVGVEGLTFVPFRGSAAPRNEPVGFAPARVAVGGEGVAFAASGVPGRAGDVLSVDRGNLVERFRCTPDGVELICEIDVPRAARGPLVLDYRLEGGYAIDAAADGGLVLHGELGDVSLGAAFAVEPGGARTPIETAPLADGFRFTVPRDVVARSEGHVVIDPFVTGGEINNNTLRIDEAVDVSADAGAGFLVAIQRAFSATDRDVFVYAVPFSNVTTGTFVATIDFSTADWTGPSIAARASRDDFLVAAEVPATGGSEVLCRRCSSDGAQVGAPFQAFEGLAPDVCVETNSNGLSPRWLVVGLPRPTAHSDRHLRALVGGTGSSVGRIGPVHAFAFYNDIQHVAIAETTGPRDNTDPTRFHVVVIDWQNGTSKIWLDTFDRDNNYVVRRTLATFIGGVREVEVGSLGDDDNGPDVRTFPVAYVRFDLFSGDSEVYVLACDENGARGPAVAAGDLTNVNRDLSRTNPSIASDGLHWTLSFEEEASFSIPGRVVVLEGSHAGGSFGLTERRISAGNAFSTYRAPATVAAGAGGVAGFTGERFMTAYVGGGGTRGLETQPRTRGAGGVQECVAEPNSAHPNGAWLSVLGRTDVSSLKTVRLADAPANQFSLLLTASSSNFVPLIGGSSGNLCLGSSEFGRFNAQVGMTDTTGVREFTFDPQQIPQALGTTAAVLSDSWWVQAWFRDTNANGATSNLSNAVRMRFDH